jgi:hypothetical protein
MSSASHTVFEQKDHDARDSLEGRFTEETAHHPYPPHDYHRESLGFGPQSPSITSTSVRRRTAVDGLTLPPPPAFDLFIEGLSIGVPPPERYLPLPVPIPVPQFLLSRKKDLDHLTQTIIHDVDAKCGSGEVLAMYVRSVSFVPFFLTRP